MKCSNRRLDRRGSYSRRPRSAVLTCCSTVSGLWLFLAGILLVSDGNQTPANAGELFGVGIMGLYGDAGFGDQQGPFTGSVDINSFLGADRFYEAGLTGSHAVMANIEAGHAWRGHETLAHVEQIARGSTAVLAESDRHATWVASVMGGRPVSENPGEYQRGMAPDARLFSGAIATSWTNSRYSTSFQFSFSNATFGPYRDAYSDGLGGGRPADVINSSWNTAGGGSDSGTNLLAGVLDALANDNPHTLMTAAAGNSLPSGEGPNRVLSAATAFNNMSVAALGPVETGYTEVSFFSNGGPNNYWDAVNGLVPLARQAVDIAAPGEDIATAYYGGETGGNRPSLSGGPDGPEGGPDWYSRSLRGTSFAAPLVAGGAALLYDAAYTILADNDDARDARVIKAVLMNSADKTVGWDNGQTAHPNGGGGVLTTQGLDNRVGTGRMNLDRAFDQFLAGTTDVAGVQHGDLGVADLVGWDFGLVDEGVTNDYLIGGPLRAGSEFTATLTWFRDRAQTGTSGFFDESFDNLDLELWTAEAGLPLALVAESRSRYNNTEHFSFTLPVTAEYMLRVRWTDELFDALDDANHETYGLAWSTVTVPEPASLALVLVAAVVGGSTWRRRK